MICGCVRLIWTLGLTQQMTSRTGLVFCSELLRSLSPLRATLRGVLNPRQWTASSGNCSSRRHCLGLPGHDGSIANLHSTLVHKRPVWFLEPRRILPTLVTDIQLLGPRRDKFLWRLRNIVNVETSLRFRKLTARIKYVFVVYYVVGV